MREAPVFRRAEAADLDAIVGLRLALERQTRDSGSMDESWRRAEVEALLAPDLASGVLLCWLAEAGGRAVAQAALRTRRPSGAGPAGEGELLNVYTEPAYRGRGIASSLVGLAIAEARALGLGRLRLQATEDSRRIYARAGFRRAGRAMVLRLGRAPGAGSIA
jgi:ribosomal protein S18 acetylase RimI-like enzyme